MKNARIAALLFLSAVLTTTAQETNSVDLSALTKNRAEWPSEVALTQKMDFPIVFDGKEIGSATLPAGMKVKLVAVQGEQVTVANVGATKTIPTSSTDLIARVIQGREVRNKAATIREEANRQFATRSQENRQAAGKLYISTDTDGGEAQANRPPRPEELAAKDAVIVTATAKKLTVLEQEDVIAVNFSHVFNIKRFDGGIYSANVTTVDGSTQLVIFSELGKGYMLSYTEVRKARIGSGDSPSEEKANGLVYAVRRPTTVVSEFTGKKVGNTAIYLVGRKESQLTGGKITYIW